MVKATRVKARVDFPKQSRLTLLASNSAQTTDPIGKTCSSSSLSLPKES